MPRLFLVCMAIIASRFSAGVSNTTNNLDFILDFISVTLLLHSE